MAGDHEAVVAARREDLREISAQVRDIQGQLSKELKANRFWKSQSERELSFLGASSNHSVGPAGRGNPGLLALKENVTPGKRGLPLVELKTPRAEGKQLVLRENEADQSGGGGGNLAVVPRAERCAHEVSLLNERLANEIEAHFETHLHLETLRDNLKDSEEREKEANRRIDTLLSEMKSRKTRQHHRESEFATNLTKHQDFLQDERLRRIQVERDLHKVLRQNHSLQKTLRDLTRVAKEKDTRLKSVSTELAGMKGQSGLPGEGEGAGAREETGGGGGGGQSMVSSLMDDLRRVREQLEEAEESAQVYREDAEAKEMHNVFLQEQLSLAEAQLTEKESELEAGTSAKLKELQSTSVNFMQVNEDLINELEEKEDELNKKCGEVEALEQKLMEKDGIIQLLRETVEGLKGTK